MSCPHSDQATAPMDSVEALIGHMRACGFNRVDIIPVAKRLQEKDSQPPRPDAHDQGALKVEKNALALVFIPAIVTVVSDFITAHPGKAFNVLLGQLGMVTLDEVRNGLPAASRQASVCHEVNGSLGSLFAYLARAYILAVADAAASGDAQMEWTVEHLVNRYGEALTHYHTHTKVSRQHFNPAGHIIAGINTALFFILRMLSAMCVLGERAQGRPITREELAACVKRTIPLLLIIARCHLEQLLLLEEPSRLDKDVGFMPDLADADYADRLAGMFLVTVDAEGLRLEIHPSILTTLPVIGSPIPQTGCPALYASAPGHANAIVAMIRLTERCFSDIMWGAEGV